MSNNVPTNEPINDDELISSSTDNYKPGQFFYNDMKNLIETGTADCNNNDDLIKSYNSINEFFDLPNYSNDLKNQFSTPIMSNSMDNHQTTISAGHWQPKSPINFGNESSASSVISTGSESANSSLMNYVGKNNIDSMMNLSGNSRRSNRLLAFPFNENLNYQEARYKTELCLHFRESNTCPHNNNCLFAHGLSELRPYRGRHPKHKTQKCKAFHEEGYCNYGYRCSYIHSESPNTIHYIKKINHRGQVDKKRRLNLNNKFQSTLNSIDKSFNISLNGYLAEIQNHEHEENLKNY